MEYTDWGRLLTERFPDRVGVEQAVGSEITAFVGGFCDRLYQIGLWQVRPT